MTKGSVPQSMYLELKHENETLRQKLNMQEKKSSQSTTDDIVARLRLWASTTQGDHVIAELHRAADEIERLRLMLTHICDVWGSELLFIVEEMNQFKKDIK